MKNLKTKESAGLIMYNILDNVPYFFLVHPAGPFWKNKEIGAWSIPKGEIEDGEKILEVAKREFIEETGIIPSEPYIELGYIKQKGGKTVYAWAFKGEYNGKLNCTSLVEMEWPRNSGKFIKFPEVDKGEMYTRENAKIYINQMQYELIERLIKII